MAEEFSLETIVTSLRQLADELEVHIQGHSGGGPPGGGVHSKGHSGDGPPGGHR